MALLKQDNPRKLLLIFLIYQQFLCGVQKNPFWGTPPSRQVYVIFVTIVELLELMRRCIWGLFRVENAHVSRKGEFRDFEFG